jgi:serine phosphatase RsbU (regulator of sigma subunit)
MDLTRGLTGAHADGRQEPASQPPTAAHEPSAARRSRHNRGSWSLLLAVAPFALVAVLGAVRLAIGSGWGILPLLAVGPAVAAVLGGVRLVMAVGAEAVVICVLFLAADQPGSDAFHRALTALLAIIGVVAAGSLASAAGARRDRDLARVRLVAEATQQVVLRPVPREAGPVKIALRYLSASEEARVGGDLYDVVSTPDYVRLVIGDAKGKGLPALRLAAAVLGAFREAAYEEVGLAAIASRLETSLARQLGSLEDEEFVTAILAEISPDGSKMELLGCGHPDPLLLTPTATRFIRLAGETLPLGLGHLTTEPRSTSTICFEPGDKVLFYTDGLTEARNRAGEFFPLADSPSLRSLWPPDMVLNGLCDEVNQHVGHVPDDDVALLLAYRGGRGPTPLRPGMTPDTT